MRVSLHSIRGIVGAALAVAVALAVAACPLGAQATTRAPTLTKVVLATGFFPSVQFAPYYLAVDKGYYRAQGLDVRIENGASPTLLRQVADGKIDFAITSGDTLVQARAAGIPVTYIMTQFQRYPVGAMALAGGKVHLRLRSPSDLKGLRIGISAPGSATEIGLRALLQAAHLTEHDVTVVAIGFTETQALVHHQVDVAMTYLSNEPVQARALGYKVQTLDTSRYMALASTGLATGAATIKRHPDLARRMVAATLMGLRDTQQHPDQALAASLKRMPEVAASPRQVRIQRQTMAATLPYEQAPVGHPEGWSNPATWATTAAFLHRIGLSKAALNPTTLYSNTFVGQAAHSVVVTDTGMRR